MNRGRAFEAGSWGLALGLGLLALAWPGWTTARAHRRAEADAALVLDRLAARERTELAVGHRYVGFDPGERERRLPGLELGEAAGLFEIDALPDPAGGLRLRAVGRPDAIRDGRIVPVLRVVELPPPA